MATPTEKLADSLEVLQALQKGGGGAVRSADLSRTHRERLVRNGFLQPVMKGWYIPTRPDEQAGDSTAWYASFWDFCAAYLNARFGAEWCLSPEHSTSDESPIVASAARASVGFPVNRPGPLNTSAAGRA